MNWSCWFVDVWNDGIIIFLCLRVTSFKFRKVRKQVTLKLSYFCYFYFSSRADMLFSNRGDGVSMCHFKEIDLGLKTKTQFWGYRTSFSGEPPFRYAQSGSERTSFSGSTVYIMCKNSLKMVSGATVKQIVVFKMTPNCICIYIYIYIYI